MPVAVVFLLRAVVLVLLWGFVVAAIVAVRHDVFGVKAPKPATVRTPRAPKPAAVPKTPKPPKAAKTPKPPRRRPAGAATKIAVIEGPSTGLAVSLASLPVTIGRAEDSTIVLSDDYVSNHHARLIPRGTEWLVEDTGSTNGTYLGSTRVTAPVVVALGGRIRIGNNVLELRG